MEKNRLKMPGIRILSTGKGLPQGIVTNDDLSQIVDTSHQWIKKRTGMEIRRHVSGAESNLSLAAAASREAIERAAADPKDIKAVVVATLSADNFTPSTACLLQKELGLSSDIIAIDVNAACSGFVFGLQTLRGLLMAQGGGLGLIVGAEVLSKKLDMTDRSTCVLFGDGAGAALVKLDFDREFCCKSGVEGDKDMINCPVSDGYIHMDGQATYRFAVAAVPGLIAKTVEQAGHSLEEIDHFILHQANLRIIESIAKKLGQPMDKFFVNIEKYGNTSAASLGLALADADEAGYFKEKDKIIMCAFGAGRTYGAIYMEW